MSQEQPEVVLECGLQYALLDREGRPVEQGRATARLTGQDLALLPESGRALLFSLREMDSVDAADYRLCLGLSSGEKLELAHIGRHYEALCRELPRLRHELAISELLIQERPVTADFRGKYVRTHPGGRTAQGACGIRLYETALIFLPQAGDIERIPYSFVAEVRPGDYRIEIEVEDDGILVLAQLGPQLDPLQRAISAAIGDLAVSTQRYLQELLPTTDPSVIRRAAPQLRDGRAARRADLDALSPALWPSLEERLAASGMAEKYGFLRSLAQPEEVCVGMKRGLMGDLTGDYIWVLLPIYDEDPARPGNAVALEAASPAGTGRATYFFRLTGRGEYPELARGPERLQQVAAAFCRRLNRWLLAVNFRREPVYLSAEKLSEPRYERYRHALRRIPELGLLRERFIGRVIHASPEQWREDVLELLRFNVSATDDALKWLSASGAGEEDPSGDLAAGEAEEERPQRTTAREPEIGGEA